MLYKAPYYIKASYNEHDCSIMNIYDCNGVTF